MSTFPAYRVHTRRTLLRCWEPMDAPMLVRAITANLDHLTPWMPWIKEEPESVDEKAARLRRFRAEFDLDQNYIYGIFAPDESEILGGTGLHARIGAGALEVGYWIDAGRVNQGLATEAAAAMTRLAFELHGVDRVEIRCEPGNAASAAVPRKLGYTHEATLRRRLISAGEEPRDGMIWALFADEYPASFSASAELEAFDALGQRLLSCAGPPHWSPVFMFTHRLATAADIPGISELMVLAIHRLQSHFLSPEQVIASAELMGLDRQLIDDGTYHVVLAAGVLVGCGGWSKRATLFGGDHTSGRDASLLDPALAPARIRAMYTHPDWTRRGIGRLIVTLCEQAARAAGFRACTLVATLAGEPLYRASGYQVIDDFEQVTASGVKVPLRRMDKALV